MDEATNPNEDWPTTRDEAVDRIVTKFSDESERIPRSMPEGEVIRFHHGWGTGISNAFGLWAGNTALILSCRRSDPDGMSPVIMEAVWQQVHDETSGTSDCG